MPHLFSFVGLIGVHFDAKIASPVVKKCFGQVVRLALAVDTFCKYVFFRGDSSAQALSAQALCVLGANAAAVAFSVPFACSTYLT